MITSDSSPLHSAPPTPGVYVPGFVREKTCMILIGLLFFGWGAWELAAPLRLVVFGQHVMAEATRVLKVKPGIPDLVLNDDAEIQAHLEPRDRSYLFWNEFAFATPEGRVVRVRANVASELKPLYPLVDADGLPTTDLVCYNPAAPEKAVFPLIISTWLVPAVIALTGLGCALIGGVLLYWARRPIELPRF